MADLTLSERNRRAVVERWKRTSPEERSRATEPARAARRTAAKRLAELEERLARVEQLLADAA